MADNPTSSPPSNQVSGVKHVIATRQLSSMVLGSQRHQEFLQGNPLDVPPCSPCMAVLIDERGKKLFRRVLGRSVFIRSDINLGIFSKNTPIQLNSESPRRASVQYVVVVLKELAIQTFVKT
ncbi:hypothetical protein ZTR_09139 [Talaromyces verruculosus]|nr:hypothetical protein ZTR_09139 [Talaromyces verruculosus]